MAEAQLRDRIAGLEAASAAAAADAVIAAREEERWRGEAASLQAEILALRDAAAAAAAAGGAGGDDHAGELRGEAAAAAAREAELLKADAAMREELSEVRAELSEVRAELVGLQAAAADGAGVIAQLGDAREKAQLALDEFEEYRRSQASAPGAACPSRAAACRARRLSPSRESGRAT